MLELNFNPFPTIETERLILKRISMTDAPNFLLLRQNSDAMKYIGKPIAKSIDDIYELINKMEDNIIQNNGISWGIYLKNGTGLVGTVGFHRILKEHFRGEIGYMLHPKHWKNGIMTEIMPKMIDYGFNNMKLHTIEANVDKDNNNSIRLLTKFNFIKEAHFKENYYFNGEFIDSVIYSLINPN